MRKFIFFQKSIRTLFSCYLRTLFTYPPRTQLRWNCKKINETIKNNFSESRFYAGLQSLCLCGFRRFFLKIGTFARFPVSYISFISLFFSNSSRHVSHSLYHFTLFLCFCKRKWPIIRIFEIKSVTRPSLLPCRIRTVLLSIIELYQNTVPQTTHFVDRVCKSAKPLYVKASLMCLFWDF